MTWLCPTAKAMMVLCKIIPRVSRDSVAFFPVCFTFGHAEATCISNSPFHQGVCFIFTYFHQIFTERGQRNHCIRAWKENFLEGASQSSAVLAPMTVLVRPIST